MVKVEIAGEIEIGKEIGTETGVEIETEIIAGKIEVHVSLCNAYSVGQNLQLQNIHAHPNGKDQGMFLPVSVHIHVTDYCYIFPLPDQEIGEIGGDLGEQMCPMYMYMLHVMMYIQMYM